MSGRLVILPHKSWNVWNQDNREKVMKDEREHREKELALTDRNNKLLQEQSLNILRDNKASKKSDSDLIPFRLFEDAEKASVPSTNDEYEKEKQTKEKRTKQREGTAAWGLGEGSCEASKIKPWYETLEKNGIDNVSQVSIREAHRKLAADPMSSFVVHSQSQFNDNKAHRNVATSQQSALSSTATVTNDKDLNKKHKKRKIDEKLDRQSKKKGRESPALVDPLIAALQIERDAVLAEIQKRMKGEVSGQTTGEDRRDSHNTRWDNHNSTERSVVSDNRYSQQYNPTIAKHIRTH